MLIPTLGRQERLPRVVENAAHPDVNVYFVMEPHEAHDVPGATTLTLPDGVKGCPSALNYGYRHTTEPLLFQGDDDLNFHDGWLEAILTRLSDTIQVVGTNDLGMVHTIRLETSPHNLVTRRYLDERGGVFDEGPGSFFSTRYTHNYADGEFVETARRRNAWAPCLESIVEHMHPLWNRGEWDDTYALSRAHFDEDKAMYVVRCREMGATP